ncbi:DUF4829 domain-containing protein, partial [Bacillus sp. APMAM]
MIKKFSFILLLSVMLLIVVFDNTQQVEASDKSSDKSPTSTIESYFNYVNSKKWESIPSLFINEREKTLAPFFENQDNQNNKNGIFNVKKANILNLKELSFDEVATSSTVEENARYFYIAVNLNVFKDDKYHMNGTNYYLVSLVEENGEWKIAELSAAPVDVYVDNNIGFGTEDEKEQAKIFEKRKEGIYLNRQGKVLEVNKQQKKENQFINKNIESNTDFSTMARATNNTPPDYIVVYVSNKTNGCIGCVVLPSFVSYIENVLPNEWYSTWPPESLRTGAIAVKMYGWYAAIYPRASSVGACFLQAESAEKCSEIYIGLQPVFTLNL